MRRGRPATRCSFCRPTPTEGGVGVPRAGEGDVTPHGHTKARRGARRPEHEVFMNGSLPVVYLARHDETTWSLTGQHTGLTDLPLTGAGERVAGLLGERLRGLIFVRVYTSRLQRARRTWELAGFGAVAEVDHNLVEWDYGQYEGGRGVDMRAERPDCQLFCDGCPGGESPAQVAKRADRVGAVTKRFVSALLLDDVVLRGGNGRKLKRMAKGYRAGDTATVFLDRFQLWKEGKK
jgi:hypothetical protein